MEKALPSQLSEFVAEGEYQQIVTDMLKMAKQLGANQAEVGLLCALGLNVTVRLGEIEVLEFNRDKTIGITVYLDHKKGSASTTDISPASLRSTVEAAINLAKFTQPDPFSGLAEQQDMAPEVQALNLYHPWDLSIDQAVRLARHCEDEARSFDKKIVNSEGATLSSTQAYHVYGNSHGFLGFYPTTKHSLSCMVIAQDLQGMERDYQYTIARQMEGLESAEKVGKQAAERAIKRLGAKKLSTQRAPVLFHATVAANFLSHFLGAISGGRLFRKTTFLLDSLHKEIFPSHIHIYERPHVPGALGSAPFDNDGVKTTDKAFVQAGVVSNYILSAYSARKLGLSNTGNAGGVHNLYIESTHQNFNELLQKMDRGLVVTELMGQGVNLVTGDYSRGAMGFWVEQGQIQYPVHEITIAGNLKTMFRDLTAVGNDVDRRGSIQSGSLLVAEMTLAGA